MQRKEQEQICLHIMKIDHFTEIKKTFKHLHSHRKTYGMTEARQQ